MVRRYASSLIRERFALETALPLSRLVKLTISGACLPPIAQGKISRPLGPCEGKRKQLPHAAKPPRRHSLERALVKRSIWPFARSASYVTEWRPCGFWRGTTVNRAENLRWGFKSAALLRSSDKLTFDTVFRVNRCRESSSARLSRFRARR